MCFYCSICCSTVLVMDPKIGLTCFSREDVSFTHDGALLKVYRTKTLLFKSKVLTIPIPRIPGSILCPVSALQQYLSCHTGSPGDPLFMLLDSQGSVKPDTSRIAAAFLFCSVFREPTVLFVYLSSFKMAF